MKRNEKLIINRRPARSAAASISRPSSAFIAIGFSHRTWQPEASAISVKSLWNLFGVQTLTTSSASAASIASAVAWRPGMPY